MKILVTLILCSFLMTTQALFENTGVHLLDANNFDEVVGDKLALVVFYSGQLSADQASIVEMTARGLRGFIRVGAVNDVELATKYEVTSFPAYVVFSNNEVKVHSGPVSSVSLINFAFDVARDVIDIFNQLFDQYTFLRIQAKIPKKKEEVVKVEVEDVEDDDVIVLDDESFHQVHDSKDAWFIDFYADWCDHCKKLEPEWAKLGKLLKGEVKVAKMDLEKNKITKDKLNLKGYPNLIFFPVGDKLEGEMEKHEGSRESQSMASWARDTKKKLRPLFMEQLLSQTQFKKDCLEYNGLCIILFVPQLSDSGVYGREQYLKIYREAVLPQKQKPFNFFWSQGADQYEFEEVFGLGGAGYPSVLAMSPKKNVYSKMRATFSKVNLDKFINNLIRGKEQVAPLRKLVPIVTVDPYVVTEEVEA